MNGLAFWLWRSAAGSAVCLAIIGQCAVGRAVEPAPAAQGSAAPFQKLLAELDSDSFEVREAAAEKLAAAGPAAVDVLAGGVMSDNAEIAWRSGAALERIAVSGDEATLARVIGILDGLSAKGKPALRSMVAEMQVRQKQFRHDRAVASLQKNGAVFTSDLMEVGGGPIFIGGPIAVDAVGPIAVEIGGIPFEGPLHDPFADAIPAPDEAPAGGGIFGLLGRMLGGAVRITEEPPPKFFEPGGDAPAIPVPGELVPDDILGPPEIDATPLAPEQIVEEFKEITREAAAEAAAKEPAPVEPASDPPSEKEATPAVEGADPAPPPDIQVIEPPPLLEEGDEIVEGELGVPFMAVDFFGGGIVALDEGEAQAAAALVLGTQWRGGDDGLKVLKDVPEIWSISLHAAKISDQSLEYIAELPNLSSLDVRQTNVSRHGLIKLREQKPSLEVLARGEAMLGVNADVGTSPLVLTTVMPDSGASLAGLREGDVISNVGGMSIKDFADLTISIYGRKAGEKVRVEYTRNGTQKTAEVTLKKRADNQ